MIKSISILLKNDFYLTFLIKLSKKLNNMVIYFSNHSK